MNTTSTVVELNDKAPLSESERGEFTRLDHIVKRGMHGFLAVGNALKEIRDHRLCREKYKTFEQYVARQHDLSRPRAYELIGASEVVQQLSGSDLSANGRQKVLPVNVRQARPLLRLEDGQRAEVWAAVKERHKKDREPITARLVESVVAEICPKERAERSKGKERQVPQPQAPEESTTQPRECPKITTESQLEDFIKQLRQAARTSRHTGGQYAAKLVTPTGNLTVEIHLARKAL